MEDPACHFTLLGMHIRLEARVYRPTKYKSLVGYSMIYYSKSLHDSYLTETKI